MQSLIRLAAAVITVVAVCFAIVQMAGRLLFWQLPRFEGAVNVLLRSSGVSVAGLRGGWQGLNPSVFAERVKLPAGQMMGFDFELDLLESLSRNRVVARRMTVVDGQLTVEKTAHGWRLQGQRGGGFDAWPLFAYSDQVWLRGRLAFRDGAQVGLLHVESMLANRDGMHRFDIHVQSERGCNDCALVVRGDLVTGGAGAIRASADRFSLGKELYAMLAGGLSPTAPLRAMRFHAAVDGDWRRDADGSEQGRLDLRVVASESPGSPGSIDLTLAAWRLGEGDYRGDVRLTLTGGEDAGRIDGSFWLHDVLDDATVDLWVPQLAIHELARPIVAVIGTAHPTGNWLDKVAPRGEIEGLGVRFDGEGLAVALRGTDGALRAHRGVPELDNMTFSVAGHGRALRLDLAARDFALAFPDIFPARVRHDSGGGTMFVAFSSGPSGAPGYIGFRAADLWTVRDGMRGELSFSLARPDDRDEVRVAVEGTVDRIAWHAARDYLPLRLAPGLRGWLQDAVHGGEFHHVRLVYRGHARTRDDQPVRRVELAANVLGGAVDYHPDWPAASDVNGAMEITADETRVFGTALAFDTELTDVALRVPHRRARAHVQLAGETTVAQLFDFVWATPVHDAMPFLSESWHGTGGVEFAADLIVPLRQRDEDEDQERAPGWDPEEQGGATSARTGEVALQRDDVRLHLHFKDATFDFADLGLRFDAMDESVSYRFPATLAGDALQGTLFGHPVRVAIDSDDDAMRFRFAGTAAVADTYRLLGMDDLGMASGMFDFDATFTLFPASDRAPELAINSNLLGVDVALPQPLGKTADDARQTTVALQFLEPHVAVSASYGDSSGWLRMDETGIRAGAFGIGTREPMIDAATGRVAISGRLDAVDASDVAALTGDAARRDTPFGWELRRFRVGALALQSVRFENLSLEGYAADGDVDLAFQSIDAAEQSATGARAEGRMTKLGEAPWQIEIADLALPAPQSDEADPLTTATIEQLFAADVVLKQVTVGGEDFGSWRFGMRPAADGVAFSNVVADIRGLRIESDGEVFWSKRNESSFAGSAKAQDLKDVLPLWEFAPSVESESFHASGDLRWPGSPLNFDLHHLSGTARLALTNGSFLDIDPGGTRILSLVNFSAIAKRMSLDFSDVFGEGVSFDRVGAELTVDDGLARFAQPAQISGTGSTFQFAGTVDLESGALDNDMVVTLPFLNNNLPWYAAFLALSNPAGAAGVLLGRQVLKDQIDRLSSGRYHVGGTFDAPEVEFVGVFDDGLDVAPDETPVDDQAASKAGQ